jgi:hypothetical protein
MKKIRFPYKLSVNWSFMRIMDIEDQENPGYVYLRRLIVFKTPWCGIYVHWIYTPDGQRDPHNHPMNFWSFVLLGGYTEHRYKISHRALIGRRRSQGSIARTTTEDFHRIVRLWRTPTITILLTGRRAQEWGFLTKGGYIPAHEYLTILEASNQPDTSK